MSARGVALAPALVVSITALFVMPQQAGGFRLAKWGAFGVALAVAALLTRADRLPRRWLLHAVFVVCAIAMPALTAPAAHWFHVVGLASGVALAVVTAIALDNGASARRASFVVLTATAGVCATLVLLQAAGLRWLTSETFTGLEFRAPGTFGNPNWAAAFLGAATPLALGLSATATRPWRWRAASAVLALATLATLSKGGAATLAAGVLVFAVARTSGRLRLALIVTSIAVATGLVAGLALHFTEAPWLRGRLFLWRVALVLIGEHPLTGVGFGGYPAAYGDGAATVLHGDITAFMPLGSVDFAHNDFLQLASECGVITIVVFVLVCASAITTSMRADDPLTQSAGAALVAILVNGLADSPLRVPATFVLFFFLLGSLAPTFQATRTARPVLVMIALLAAFQGLRFFAGDAYWTLGRDALRANRPAVSTLARARFFMPEHGRSASAYIMALSRAGRIDAALRASVKAAELRFDFDDEILRRDLQERSLDTMASIALWQDFSVSFPALVTPHVRLGGLYLLARDLPAAIDAYETVLASRQPTARAEDARNQARSILERFDGIDRDSLKMRCEGGEAHDKVDERHDVAEHQRWYQPEHGR